MALFRGLKVEGETLVQKGTVSLTSNPQGEQWKMPPGPFDWPGPSPESLALAGLLLCEALPVAEAVGLQHRFEAEVVARWEGPEWACTTEGIRAWASDLLPLTAQNYPPEEISRQLDRFHAIRFKSGHRPEVQNG